MEGFWCLLLWHRMVTAEVEAELGHDSCARKCPGYELRVLV